MPCRDDDETPSLPVQRDFHVLVVARHFESYSVTSTSVRNGSAWECKGTE